jgi:microcystin degradation protein MlrC
MRVGIIALQHESNTFAKGLTTLEQFRGDRFLVGREVRERLADSNHETGGFFEGLAEAGVEAVPILAAAAVPGGVIEQETFEALVRTAMHGLQSCGRLDGLLVAPHGAAVSEGERDADGYWLDRVREEVGPDIPMICTIDPHANVSPRMIVACDATIAYRTNPHLDQRQTGLAAARLMARTLRGEVRPVQALASPPVAISIDRQETEAQPCRKLYEQADRVRSEAAVLSASVVLGFPYADVPEVGSGFIVVTDNDETAAISLANRLGGWLIEHRLQFACALPSVERAVREAAGAPERVCLLDVGDNVGGGAPGDSTVLAHALLSHGVERTFVCLYDPEAARKARALQPGGRIRLAMGGRIDSRQGPPLTADVELISVHEGRYTETQVRHGGAGRYDMGPTAVVRGPREMTIMLTSRRVAPVSLQQLISGGIDPASFRVLVAKGVNAPIAAYREVCDRFIRANTPGVTCADMTLLPFAGRRRPLFPFEPL